MLSHLVTGTCDVEIVDILRRTYMSLVNEPPGTIRKKQLSIVIDLTYSSITFGIDLEMLNPFRLTMNEFVQKRLPHLRSQLVNNSSVRG
jgi:hypothetical protein